MAPKEIVLGVTGGADSRVLLAALLAHDARVTGCTWTGPGRLARGEAAIVDRLVHAARLTNVPVEVPAEDDSPVAQLASFNAPIHRGATITAAMARVWGHNPRAIFVRGWGGEVMRGFYSTSKGPLSDASPRELMRAYGSGVKIRPVSAEYERRCLPFFERWAEITRLDDAVALGHDPNDLFYWEHRMGIWGASMLNGLDPAMNNLTGLNSRAMFSAAYGLPRAERLTKDLFARLVERYDPRLAAHGYC